MSTNDFGKDFGLIHQVVSNGRRRGADRAVWAVLAYPNGIFEEMVAKAKAWLEVSGEDRKQVAEWKARCIENMPWPFREPETYYTRSDRRCEFDRRSRELHVNARELFVKAEHNPAAREICEDMECYFLLAYLYSTVYAAVHHGDRQWGHDPLWAFVRNFSDLIEDDPRTRRGQYLTYEHLIGNQNVIQINETLTGSSKGWSSDQRSRADMLEMLTVCERAMRNQLDSILAE